MIEKKRARLDEGGECVWGSEKALYESATRALVTMIEGRIVDTVTSVNDTVEEEVTTKFDEQTTVVYAS